MVDKKFYICLGVVVLFLIMFMAATPQDNTNTTTGDKNPEYKNVSLNGIVFTAPETNNNTTSYTRTPTGDSVWSYDDYENNVSVYVQTMYPNGYDTVEQWSKWEGYSQMRPIGDYWMIVIADDASDKDLCYDSAHVE